MWSRAQLSEANSPTAVQLPDAQGPHSQWITDGQQEIARQTHQGVGSTNPPHRVGNPVWPVADRRVGEKVRQHLGVARRVEFNAPTRHLVPKLRRVHQVPVVPDGDLDARPAGDHRLSILDEAAARGGVPRVAYGYMAGQALKVGLLEALYEEAHGRMDPDLLAVGAGYADALLTAVLKGKCPEEGFRGCLLV